MTYDEAYPTAFLLQRVTAAVFKANPGTCMGCGAVTSFVTYAFPRPAIPVCSSKCHKRLERIATGKE